MLHEEELPDIFCEATDLLNLPQICLDPVSDKLYDTTMSLESLAQDVKSLQEELSNSVTSYVQNMQFGQIRLKSPVFLKAWTQNSYLYSKL